MDLAKSWKDLLFKKKKKGERLQGQLMVFAPGQYS